MKKLYRSRDHRVIAGVAGGLAEYFAIDVALVRLVWLLLLFAGGAGFFAYIVGAIIIPEEPVGGARYSDGTVIDATATPSSSETPSPSAAGGPDTGEATPNDVKVRRLHGDGPSVGGWILVGLGLYFLAREFVPWFALGKFWPLILIVAGAAVLAGAFRR